MCDPRVQTLMSPGSSEALLILSLAGNAIERVSGTVNSARQWRHERPLRQTAPRARRSRATFWVTEVLDPPHPHHFPCAPCAAHRRSEPQCADYSHLYYPASDWSCRHIETRSAAAATLSSDWMTEAECLARKPCAGGKVSPSTLVRKSEALVLSWRKRMAADADVKGA